MNPITCYQINITYWYHPDYLGSIEWVTNADGRPMEYFWYSPWGETLQADNSWRGRFSSPFKFTGHIEDEETGLTYAGARYYPARESQWLSVDAMAEYFPSWTPYHYVHNNPINRIDPDGRWDVEFNEEGTKVLFKAQKDDNLETLAIQLGVTLEELSDYMDENFEEGKLYDFDKVDKVGKINSSLRQMNSPDFNCSNFALKINGIFQEPAFSNGGDGFDQMEDAAEILRIYFSNILESETSIGDIVTFGYSESLLKRESPHQNTSELYTPRYTDTPGHYAIVLLKSKDGIRVQKILEKSGKLSPKFNSFSNYQSRLYTPRPQTGGNSPFYRNNL